MHRLICLSLMLFWAAMFGGSAHLSLLSHLHGFANKVPISQFSGQFSQLTAGAHGHQLMPVLLMIVVSLFIWAMLALLVSDEGDFREIEAYSYASAIGMMTACFVLAVASDGAFTILPAIVTAALVTSAAASRFLEVFENGEPKVDAGQKFARQMALGAAHNSLLAQVSGRSLPGSVAHRPTVTPFPTRPQNRGNF